MIQYIFTFSFFSLPCLWRQDKIWGRKDIKPKVMTQSLKKKYKRRRACQLFISCPQTSNQVPSLRQLSSDHQFPPRPLQPPIQSAQPPNLEARMPSPRTAAAKARRSITSSFEEEVGIILSTTFPFCIFQPLGWLAIVKDGVQRIFLWPQHVSKCFKEYPSTGDRGSKDGVRL